MQKPTMMLGRTIRCHTSQTIARPVPGARHFLWAAGFIFTLTVYGSLLPFNFYPRTFAEAWHHFFPITWFPSDHLGARGDWVISAVQYAILSYLFVGAVSVDRSARVAWIAAFVIVPASVVLAVVIEFVQMSFPPRTVSLNDIIFESIGAALGVTLWLAAGQRITAWVRRINNVTNVTKLAARLMLAYLISLLIVKLMPFDLVVDWAEFALKYNEGKIQFNPFGGPWDADRWAAIFLNLSSFVPLGALQFFAAGRRNGKPSAAFWVVLLTPIICELLQLFVYSRSSTMTDVITGTMGVLLGRFLARRLDQHLRLSANQHSRHDRMPIYATLAWSALITGWLAVLFWANWHPFDFTTNPDSFANDPSKLPLRGIRRFSFAPFVDYYWGSKYNALDQFAKKGLSFLPLGIVFALLTRNVYVRGGTQIVVLIAFLLGCAVEFGRYFLPERVPSITDILIGCAGAAIGYWITRHIRATFWADSALYGWMSNSEQSGSAFERYNNNFIVIDLRSLNP